MAVFEAVLAGGILVGNISSSYLFYATNYVWVFTVAAGLCALGLLYTVFFIPESVQNPETQVCQLFTIIISQVIHCLFILKTS